jgi:hypothetical protein
LINTRYFDLDQNKKLPLAVVYQMRMMLYWGRVRNIGISAGQSFGADVGS